MKARLTEFLDSLVQLCEQNPGEVPSESWLRRALSEQGYTKRDVDQAIRYVRPRLQALEEQTHAACGPMPVRTLADFEAIKLSPEARSALARLEAYGLLAPWEREALLDRVLQTEGTVDMDELDYLLGNLVYNFRDVESQQVVYNVFEGKTDAFH